MRTLVVLLVAVSASGCAYYIHDDAPRATRASHGPGVPCGAGVIGLSLGRGPGHRLIANRVADDGPAALAGIRPGDRVVAIDGEPTGYMSVREAAHMIRGPVDAAVEIRVRSPRGARLITLVRVPASQVWGSAACGRRHGRMRGENQDRDEPDDVPPPAGWPPTEPGHCRP